MALEQKVLDSETKSSVLEMKPDEYKNVKDIIKWSRAILREKHNMELGAVHGANRNSSGSHGFYINERTGQTFWCKFDRSNFMKFSQEFREYYGTVGETINHDIIKNLNDDDIIVIGKPNAIYFVSVKAVKDFGRDRLNDADGQVQTISFPIQILERLDA